MQGQQLSVQGHKTEEVSFFAITEIVYKLSMNCFGTNNKMRQ